MVDLSPYDFMDSDRKNEICMRGTTNSHAQNTKRKNIPDDTPDLTALIDWLSVTFSTDYYNLDFVLTLLFKYLDLPYFSSINDKDSKNTIWQFNQILEKGYPESLNYGHIAIMYNSKNRGIKLSLSGQGCKEFELLLKDGYTWFDFLQEVSTYEVNFTRIDIAIDDRKGYFNIGELIELGNKGYIRSKFKTFEGKGKRETATGKSLGHTLELGSRKSRLFIRMYEKNKEQGLSDDYVWNRIELQIMNERADTTVELIKDGDKHIGEYAMGLLKYYVTFTDPYRKINKDGSEGVRLKPDDNKSRWLMLKQWEDFINDYDKIRLTSELPKSNVETKKKWLEDKIAKTIAISVLADYEDDYDMNWLKGIIYRGFLDLDDKDKALINKYRENKKRTAHKNNRQFSQIIDINN